MTYKAPLVFLVCYDKKISWKNTEDQCYEAYDSGEMDASIIATHMMMEAADLGPGSLWTRAFDSKKIIEGFGLPDNIIPACLLSVGHPAKGCRPAKLHVLSREIGEMIEIL